MQNVRNVQFALGNHSTAVLKVLKVWYIHRHSSVIVKRTLRTNSQYTVILGAYGIIRKALLISVLLLNSEARG